MLVQHDMCPTKMSPCSVTFDTVTAHSKVHMCNIQKDIRHNHPSTTWVSSQSSPYWGTVWGISSSPSWQLKSLGGSTWESVTHSPWHMWPPGTGEFWDPTGSDTSASFSSRNAFDLLSDLHGDWNEGQVFLLPLPSRVPNTCTDLFGPRIVMVIFHGPSWLMTRVQKQIELYNDILWGIYWHMSFNIGHPQKQNSCLRCSMC